MDWGMAASEVRRGESVPRGLLVWRDQRVSQQGFPGHDGEGMANKKNFVQRRNS